MERLRWPRSTRTPSRIDHDEALRFNRQNSVVWAGSIRSSTARTAAFIRTTAADSGADLAEPVRARPRRDQRREAVGY